jgi:cytidylate kinase
MKAENGPEAARKWIIAIDGPSSAGKSTVAKRLARELGYTYMDTGAMYRAFALKVLKEKVDWTREEELQKALDHTDIELREEEGKLKVCLDGRDVSSEIRTPELSQMASKISGLKRVREKMVELQRALGARGGVVAEGRDMGTVVFPLADVKIYLDASAEERAMRRCKELQSQGQPVDLEKTRAEMEERDRRDSERTWSPLRKADDAVAIDSTCLEVDQVLDLILGEIAQKMSVIR